MIPFAVNLLRYDGSNVVIQIEIQVAGTLEPSALSSLLERALRQRLEKLGGSFEIKSKSGSGTEVRFEMPLQ